MSTYEEYRQLRRECGYCDDYGFLHETVWEACEPAAQENMLGQLRAVAAELQAELDKFGGDHW